MGVGIRRRARFVRVACLGQLKWRVASNGQWAAPAGIGHDLGRLRLSGLAEGALLAVAHAVGVLFAAFTAVVGAATLRCS